MPTEFATGALGRALLVAVLSCALPTLAGASEKSGKAPLARPIKPGVEPSPFRLSIAHSEYRVVGAARATQPRHKAAGEFSPAVERHAKARGLDPDLVHAVIRAESAYRPGAVSPKGAVGLMQVMPATGLRFGVADLESPENNLRAGTAYLRHLLDRFNNVSLALAAYNAGEGAVMRYGNQIPPYAETQGYVRNIMREYGEVATPAAPLPKVYGDGVRLTSRDLAPYRLNAAALK